MTKKFLIIGLIVLMVLPLVKADIMVPSPREISKVTNIGDFSDYTFVMIYHAPHVSRGPSFAIIIDEDGHISETSRYGDYARLYAIENSKLEDGNLVRLLLELDEADSFDVDSVNEVEQYMINEGIIVVKALLASSGGSLGTNYIEYTLYGLENENFTITMNGYDVTHKYDDDITNDSDRVIRRKLPFSYLSLSLIALIIIGYIIYKKKNKKLKKVKKSKRRKK